MSAFEIAVTPTRKRIVKKNSSGKSENREPTYISFGPFSGKSVVTFENVPLTKTAHRTLIIQNPTKEEIKVLVTRIFPPEYNVKFEWTSINIEANGQASMEISWTPSKEISCRNTLQLTDSRNFKKDVTFIFKSVKIKKKNQSVTTSRLSSSGHSATIKLKIKSPTGIRLNKRQSLQNTENIAKVKFDNEYQAPLPLSNKNQNLIEPSSFKISSTMFSFGNKGKENINSPSPRDVSTLFDNIQFTPISDKQSKEKHDYLASLPTPDNNSVFRFSANNENIPAMVITSPKNECISNYKTNQAITPRYRRLEMKNASCRFENSGNALIESKNDLQGKRLLLNELDKSPKEQNSIANKTFDIIDKISQDQSINQQHNETEVMMNCTTTICQNAPKLLSIIEEEGTYCHSTEYNAEKTFNFSPSHQLKSNSNKLHQEKINCTPLRKFSESMKDLSGKNLLEGRKGSAIGSMPNLSDMEILDSITENRYYNNNQNKRDIEFLNISTVSIANTTDIHFNHNDIRATSSRYNINCDQGVNSIKRSPKFSTIQYKSMLSSPKGASSTTALSRPRKISLSPKEPNLIRSTPTLAYSPLSKESKKRLRRSSDEILSENESEMIYLSINQPVCMAISPPKRTKFDLQKNYQPNFMKPGSAKKKLLTPRKIQQDTRDSLLYNQDLLFSNVINPDPFAATTTCDPFLTATMYLDAKAVNKYEMDISKWLNALVSMPEEFNSDCNQKIDIANLFNEARNKNLILVPTKEQLSMNYLTTSRMEALRMASVKLYQSPELAEPCGKVSIQINKKMIHIRDDRDLHLDVVLQRNMLELLLSFNIVWLRIGLETVFGERIPMHSNSDIVGLSCFILNRLFRDKLLEQKRSRAYALSKEYASYIKKFTLQKFLLLIIFLDKAKEKRIIKHNPCLFTKTSKYKETREILIRFSSELIGSVGDITRVLRRYGYNLTHKQTFLDEYDFAFNNLAIDLRDGVRLSRVMEIILMRDDITQQLRVPAISRLQKVYNVNLSLDALKNADFQLLGNITAADIVDGHREKTLSLLWQIIYKFRSPKFNAAATTIQKWWRSLSLKVWIRRKIREKEELRKNKAATTIQSAYRGYKTRKYVKTLYEERSKAAICLQKHYRRHLAEKQFARQYNSILIIQRWYRSCKAIEKERKQYLHIKSMVVKIQVWYRRIMFARKLEKVAKIIEECKIQARLEYNSAVVIQKTMKSLMIRKKICSVVNEVISQNRKIKLENESASKIQSFFKMVVIRKQFLIKKNAVAKIENYWIKYIQMKAIRLEFVQKRQAAIVIQKYFRAYIQRKKYLKMRSSIIAVQRRFRANKLAAIQKQNYQHIRQNVTKIQRYYRSVLETRRIRAEYQELRTATITIQRRFRANQEMRHQVTEYQQTKLAIIAVQRRFRAKLLMKVERMQYLHLRNCTIKIQQKFRATLLAKQHRYDFLVLRRTTIFIQQQFRANLAMRKQRSEYLNLKQHVITIQQRYRAKLKMKTERARYLKMKQAAIVIQRRFRANKVMEMNRNNYQQLRRSAITIQRRFRANYFMRIQRANFLKIKNAVIVIQRKWRATLQKNKEQSEYQKMRDSATKIQQWYRGIIKMRQERTNYLNIREKICKIQFKWKATLQMRAERKEFLKLKATTILIQRKYRSLLQMQIEQAKFFSIKRTVIQIQSYARGYLARKKFNEINTPENREQYKQMRAAITIQRYYRGFVIRNKLKYHTKLRDIRVKLDISKRNVKIQNTINYQMSSSIKFLKDRYNVQDALSALTKLENISRTLPHLLLPDSEFLSNFCYGMMAQTIRSEIDKQLIELCSRIILNMARYDCSKMFKEQGLVTIAQMLLRWCDKDCSIFNTLCTLIWLFSHDLERKRKIRTFMTTHEAMFMLRETRKLVLRKENMKKNIRKSSVAYTPQKKNLLTPITAKTLPSLEPEFGVLRTKPYSFICSVFAFDTVLDILRINLNQF